MSALQLKRSSYDYVFLGMGCATLSLVVRMLKSGKFSDKQFLLIDKVPKTKNDRTWCFWETKPGFFEEVVYKSWPSVSIVSDDYTAEMNIAPYTYKMIRGIDFYKYCLKEISKQANVEIVYGEVGDWHWRREGIQIILDGKEQQLEADQVFNSIYDPAEANEKTIRLLQHFKGWTIETDHPAFDPSTAIMMDFRVPQNRGTSFGYLLPSAGNRAMIEYTQFTPSLLKPHEYDTELKNYIENILEIKEYRITEEEFGVIPMTNEKFHFGTKGWNIGTAGGQTKASSGYTFQFIQKQSEEILQKLINKESLNSVKQTPARFRFYDNVLLHILYHNQLPGHKIFSRLFRKNKAQQVLKFLDNESSLLEELKIISSLPTWPFLKAALRV